MNTPPAHSTNTLLAERETFTGDPNCDSPLVLKYEDDQKTVYGCEKCGHESVVLKRGHKQPKETPLSKLRKERDAWKERAEKVEAKLSEKRDDIGLNGCIERLTQDRDILIQNEKGFEQRIIDLVLERNDLKQKLAEALAEIERLKEYAQHTPTCARKPGVEGAGCDCGFAEVMAGARTK